MMTPADKVFVAGHRGLVGSAIVRNLQQRGYARVVTRTRDELDLQDAAVVRRFFAAERPDVVFLAAAKVGGIKANATFRADFILQNLAIQGNVLGAAHAADVRRLVFLGSSCIYPREARQPMREDALLTGPLEPTNRPYAVAKIAGLEAVDALRRQHGRDWFSAMPTNLFGPGDNFDPETSHVLPALLRRFHEAARARAPEVKVWGTGKALREFLFSDDCADALVHLAETVPATAFQGPWSHVNVGSGAEMSIAQLAATLAAVTGFEGKISFDASKPDGAPRKLLDCSLLASFGWRPKTAFADAVAQTLRWYLASSTQKVPA
jgi:nucleoside-diphosphate-sugar epimerase